ncbi:MAG TPA: hypothetical protein PKY96_10085 [Flavobacteriales bacterium]|nr:hypothetical protein [Flavobacteriales bacterium]
MKLRVLFVQLLWVFALSTSAQQTSVLFIGNSYTGVNDLPNTLRQLALSLGDTMTVASSAPGGYTLFQHSTYAPTVSAINSQPWDFVVLQEQSQLGALPMAVTTTELGASALAELIEENWECTYPVFYMTWGRQNGDAQNCANFPFMCTYDGMQQGLRSNYIALAEANDGYTAPVGAAWKMVRDTQPQINLYDADGSHPSPAGTYLAACVFYCTLYQESCVGASFNGSIDAATAAILRGIASAAVLDEPLTWNLDAPNGTSALLDGASVGPDWITLIHNGQGTHLWTCTNGQSFTTGTVTFTFETSDTYYVTHTYNDPCGNSDTVTLTFNVVVGIEEQASGASYRVLSSSPGFLDVQGAKGGETLTLFDARGRMLATERLGHGNVQVACPAGLLLWTIGDGSGAIMSGRALVH